MLNKIKKDIDELQDELKNIRRYLHQNPEIGFQLNNTYHFVFQKLQEYGLHPKKCGKCGIKAIIGHHNKKVFLLRADMDALPIEEKNNLTYKSNNNHMHACGHDLHTSMLLGACKILKKYENELNGMVKIMFQPAEEIFEGAKDMINDGILKNPKVDAGMMIHVSTASSEPMGTLQLPPPGINAPSADYFEIEIRGKSSHGANPELGIDPITTSAHIILALQNIVTKEISFNDNLLISIGQIQGGKASNIIADKITIKGTIRTYREEIRAFVKSRIKEVSTKIAQSFRCESKVKYTSGTPCLEIDQNLYKIEKKLLEKEFKNQFITIDHQTHKSVGSEDFSYISQQIPIIMINLSAGSKNEGYTFPLHNSFTKFNDDILTQGVKLFVISALNYLNN